MLKDKRMNILILIVSAICHLFLCFTTKNIILVTLGNVLFLVFIIKNKYSGYLTDFSILKMKKKEILFVSAFDFILASAFFSRWITTGKMDKYAEMINIPSILIIIAMMVFLAAGSFIFISNYLILLKRVISETRLVTHFEDNDKQNIKELIICMISSFIMVTICSRSSFLYPFNDDIDINCFFTVGKGMFNHLVPYRDLYEQKGPLLYFIYGLAWYISNKSFLGAYFEEVLLGFFWLFYSYKIMSIYYGKKTIIFVPVMSFIAYTSLTFSKGGSAEEICAPIITYLLWTAIKHYEKKIKYKNYEFLYIGFLAGCVFWIKFTLVGAFVGWFIGICYSYILEKQFAKIIKSLFLIVLGVVLATLPWVVYFGINNAIFDWLEVYIYDNLFYYSHSNVKTGGIWYNLSLGVNHIISVYTILWFFIIFFSVWCNVKKRCNYLFVLLFALIFAYIGGTSFTYYAYIFTAFIPLLLIGVMDFISNILAGCLEKLKEIMGENKVVIGTIVILAILSFFISNNTFLIGTNKEDTPYYQFKEIICQEENSTLLNYAVLDMGFYTVCDILPNCKSFCALNNPVEKFMDEHQYYYENGLCDFLVTIDGIEVNDKYQLIATCDYNCDGIPVTYCLYRKIN